MSHLGLRPKFKDLSTPPPVGWNLWTIFFILDFVWAFNTVHISRNLLKWKPIGYFHNPIYESPRVRKSFLKQRSRFGFLQIISNILLILFINPIECGGGGSRSPPYHINVVPRKMLKEKVADLFYFSLICEWSVGDYFLQSNNIWSSRERAKVVKIGPVS